MCLIGLQNIKGDLQSNLSIDKGHMPSKEKPKASQKGQRPLKTLCKSSNNGPKGTMYSNKKNKDTLFNLKFIPENTFGHIAPTTYCNLRLHGHIKY